MITVIPANRNFEFKRTSRGSLSVNDASGSICGTTINSPLSPRSPTRNSPGLLTPVTFEDQPIELPVPSVIGGLSFAEAEKQFCDKLTKTSTANNSSKQTMQSSPLVTFELDLLCATHCKKQIEAILELLVNTLTIVSECYCEETCTLNIVLEKIKNHNDDDDGENEVEENNFVNEVSKLEQASEEKLSSLQLN